MRVLPILAAILTTAAVPVAGASATTPGTQVLGAPELQPADPDLAIAPSGAQVIAFTGRSESGFAVLTRSRARAGGPWGPAVRVSPVARTRPADPAVAIDPRGAAVVIWRSPDEPVRSAVRRSAGAEWTRLSVAGGPAGFDSPAVALTDGIATAAWVDGRGSARRAHRAVLDLAAGAWRVSAPLAVDGATAVSVGGDGTVAAVWAGPDAGASGVDATADATPGPVGASRHAPAAAGWEPPVKLSDAGSNPSADVADDGSTIAGWKDVMHAPVNRAALRPAGSAGWSPPEDIGGGRFGPSVAVNGRGEALAAWLGPNDGGPAPFDVFARRRRGDAWEATVRLDAVDVGGSNALVDLDDLGNGFIAVLDPEGPGSATVRGSVWTRPAPAPVEAGGLAVGGDGERFALASSGRGDALLASTRSLAVDDPARNTDLVGTPLRVTTCGPQVIDDRTTPDGTVTLSATQLRINQRISSAGIRRADAIEAWLDAGIEARDLCGGAIVASVLGPGVEAGAPATARGRFSADPRPLRIAPPARKTGVEFTLSAAQLRINQRIASRVVRQANALTARLDDGLSGGDLAAGAVTPETLAPTIGLVAVAAGPTPPPTRTALAPATTKTGVTFTLSAEQLRINQRIATGRDPPAQRGAPTTRHRAHRVGSATGDGDGVGHRDGVRSDAVAPGRDGAGSVLPVLGEARGSTEIATALPAKARTSRRADEPTSRRADEPTSRRADEPTEAPPRDRRPCGGLDEPAPGRPLRSH